MSKQAGENAVQHPTIKKKVKTRADLVDFEKKLGVPKFVAALATEFVEKIGAKLLTPRTVCLRLEAEIFDRDFWKICSWGGGSRERGVEKFALADHKYFLSWFKQSVRKLANAPSTDDSFGEFFKMMMRNRHKPTPHRLKAEKNRPKKAKKSVVNEDDNHDGSEDFMEFDDGTENENGTGGSNQTHVDDDGTVNQNTDDPNQIAAMTDSERTGGSNQMQAEDEKH